MQIYETKARITRDELRSDTYKMDYPRRGKAVIINIRNFLPNLVRQGLTERKGTDTDASRICKRLQLLGFQVEKHQDLTAKEIHQVLDQSSTEDHSDADCFICVLLSHGEPEMIYGTDETVKLTDIFLKFDGINCPTLRGKPKIFIIQACRGRQFDEGKEILVARNVVDAKMIFPEQAEMDESIRIPKEADFSIAQSTVPGYYSWRHSLNGSWFIQALVRVLDKFGSTANFLQLLTIVNREVAYNFESNTMHSCTDRMKQVPAFTSRLTKDLYFHPK